MPVTESQFFGFHIHEGTDCCGAGFLNTGSHLNPFQTNHPDHVGGSSSTAGCTEKGLPESIERPVLPGGSYWQNGNHPQKSG